MHGCLYNSNVGGDFMASWKKKKQRNVSHKDVFPLYLKIKLFQLTVDMFKLKLYKSVIVYNIDK